MGRYGHYGRKSRKRQRTETSKKLAFTVTAAFVLTAAVSWASWFILGDVPGQLLNFVAAPFSIVVTGYFTKACFENREKIKRASLSSAADEYWGADK